MKKALALILVMLIIPHQAHAQYSGPTKQFPKWEHILKHEKLKNISTTPPEDIRELLETIGTRYEKIRYATDKEIYGVDDYWATRKTMLKKQAGDCEDFAIAAFFDAIEAGVPESDIHILIVIERQTNEIHSYLQVGEWVLDRHNRFKVISAKDAAIYYAPVYSLDRKGWKYLCADYLCSAFPRKP